MKILATIILSLFAIIVLATSHGTASATENHNENPNECEQVYEIDVDEDSESDAHLTFSESGGKIDVLFNDTDGTTPSEDDRNEVIVTAGTGYEIVNVQYELEHYSGIGWITVPGNNPITTITLAGIDDDSRIDEVEVKLKKVCPSDTPTPTATPTMTPTPTTQPSNLGGAGDGRSDGRSDGLSSCPSCTQAPQGQVLGTSTQAVLGASTMAKTGSFAQTLMILYGIFGMLLLTAGYKSYAKEKKLS